MSCLTFLDFKRYIFKSDNYVMKYLKAHTERINRITHVNEYRTEAM